MKKYSVLVIDDQDNWRELLVDLLDDRFDAKSAKDYEGALEIIQNQTPSFHVVVTDMRLKDEEVGNEDGLKLIKYLNERGDETKTIVVTGYATLDSAKRAISALAAYDYLEKRPSDGSPFNVKEFQQIVYRAAQEAEGKRPKGFTDISFNVLVLEPDLAQGSKMEDILRKDGYQVTTLQSVYKLESLLYNVDKDFALILVNESLSTDELFGKLQNLYPAGKIIILTSSDIENIMDAMHEHPILTALTVSNGQLSAKSLREIRNALSAKKYISAQINFLDQPEQAVTKGMIGQSYQVNFSIQDTPLKNAIGVNLGPHGNKKGKIKLHLSVHAKGVKIEPETERFWDIPLSSERPVSCSFLITPESVGHKDITIEIDQENHFLGRIQMKFDATS